MTHFYKYVTPSTALAILRGRRLRWGSPPTLNDPFDMQFGFQLRIDRAAVISRTADKQWQHQYGRLLDRPVNNLGRMIRSVRGEIPYEDRFAFYDRIKPGVDQSLAIAEDLLAGLNTFVRETISNDKIFCVSEVGDNIPMWSYYSTNHSGAVFIFDNEIHESPLIHARPVRYVDQVPSVFDEEFISDFLAGYGEMDRSIILDLAIFTKYHSWKHEQEWRVYSGQGRTRDAFEDVLFNGRELHGVIFGARSTTEFRADVTTILSRDYDHALTYEARPLLDAYPLDIRQL